MVLKIGGALGILGPQVDQGGPDEYKAIHLHGLCHSAPHLRL